MIFLKHFFLPTINAEEGFLDKFPRTCYDSYYPFKFFPDKGLSCMDFSDVTILCGGNGSGKSTMLNVIAEKLQLGRTVPYNKTYFFEPFLESCDFEMAEVNPDDEFGFTVRSRIISSDDVFNHIIDVRKKNEGIDFKRELIFAKKREIRGNGWHNYLTFDADDPNSVKKYLDNYKLFKSASKFTRKNVGVDERTYSNGENGFKFITDAIQPGGLYLLDEPENSLAPVMQLELLQYIVGMVQGYNCQFIISTHSPFLLSIPGALIYNMDAEPVTTAKWTELENVRIYHDFFQDHALEFQRMELSNPERAKK